METIGLRLKKYLEYKEVSRITFCDFIGMKYNSLSRIINGTAAMNSDTLEKIFNYFPDLNTRWFITGKGPMEYTATSYHLDPVLEQKEYLIDRPIEAVNCDPADYVKNISEKELDILLDDFIEKDHIREKFKKMVIESLGENIKNKK